MQSPNNIPSNEEQTQYRGNIGLILDVVLRIARALEEYGITCAEHADSAALYDACQRLVDTADYAIRAIQRRELPLYEGEMSFTEAMDRAMEFLTIAKSATPGPWDVDMKEDGTHEIVARRFWTIAKLVRNKYRKDYPYTYEADARLLASAREMADILAVFVGLLSFVRYYISLLEPVRVEREGKYVWSCCGADADGDHDEHCPIMAVRYVLEIESMKEQEVDDDRG